jgi:hypothetical protein
MISYEDVMKIANENNLTLLRKKEHYAVYSYQNVEVCAISWNPDKLSWVHNFVTVSTEVLFQEDKINSNVKIYWGGTTFIDIITKKEHFKDFCEKLKKLCENIDKAVIVFKQMNTASKIAVIEGE